MHPSEADRLARLAARDPAAARAAVARAAGPELAGLAHVVLQHRPAAEAAAAEGIAAVLADEATRSGAAFRGALVGSTLAAALRRARADREVEPASPGSGSPPVALPPRQRAVATAVHLGGLSVEAAGVALRVRRRQATASLAQAVEALGDEAALRAWLVAQAGDLPFVVDMTAVDHAAAALAAPVAPKVHWLGRLAAVPVAAVVAVAGLAMLGETAPDERAPSPAARAAAPLTPAACDIRPADAEVAHAGWLTRGQLLGPEVADPGVPVYAVVTAGTASWHGPSRTGWPPFLGLEGRLGCAVDPASGAITVHAVPDDWQSPELIDGCPASPFGWYAGYREIGGPQGFVLLPPISSSWWADDPSVRILARLSPGPPAGGAVSARARPLGSGDPVTLRVDSPPTPDGRDPSPAHYIWLEDVRFPAAGCWVVSLEIDGEEVGSAVLPVTARPG